MQAAKSSETRGLLDRFGLYFHRLEDAPLLFFYFPLSSCVNIIIKRYVRVCVCVLLLFFFYMCGIRERKPETIDSSA